MSFIRIFPISHFALIVLVLVFSGLQTLGSRHFLIASEINHVAVVVKRSHLFPSFLTSVTYTSTFSTGAWIGVKVVIVVQVTKSRTLLLHLVDVTSTCGDLICVEKILMFLEEFAICF